MAKLFQFVNLLPMPVWLAMMFALRAQVTQKASCSSIVLWTDGARLRLVTLCRLSWDAGKPVGPSLRPISRRWMGSAGLGTPEGALAAWSHIRAGARPVCRRVDSPRVDAAGRARLACVPSLFFTLMTGPFGLLMFLVWRALGPGNRCRSHLKFEETVRCNRLS